MTSIFHSIEFFHLHDGTKWLESGGVYLPLWGNEEYLSPKHGTYCGFSGSSLSDMEDIVSQIDKPCRIKLAPSGHDQELFSLSVNVLLRNGFKIVEHELNYERHVVGGFEESLSKSNRKIYRNSLYIKKDITIENAYRLIQESRKRKGRDLSMSFEQVDKMHKAVGFHVFSVGTPSGYYGAALCLLVRPDILYVYAWGDGVGKSPTVKLAGIIYDYCKANGIRMMDIGTSTVNGVPDEGLIAFKRSLGFRESLKLTMERC